MRKAFLLLFIASILLAPGACKKTTESVVDCIVESLFVSVKYTADAANSKTINFEVNYSGTNTLQSVEWVYGDGNTAKVNSSTSTHTYSNTGPYSVKAKVSIGNGNSSCTSEQEKNITVN
jgi:PKD repeat protein